MTASADDSTGSSPGLRIATIGGVPVYLARSWPVVAALIVIFAALKIASRHPFLSLPGAFLVALAFTGVLVVSLLVHEAAHAAVARRLGGRVTAVVVHLGGRHSEYDSSITRPMNMALLAISGPAANAFLAVFGLLALRVVPHGGVASLLVGTTIFINVVLAGFHLAPGLPMDGGLLVQSVVWRISGTRDGALLTVGIWGRALSVLVFAWFAGRTFSDQASMNLAVLAWAFFMAIHLWMGASRAIHNARMKLGADPSYRSTPHDEAALSLGPSQPT
jgi:Zn-dependent protease